MFKFPNTITQELISSGIIIAAAILVLFLGKLFLNKQDLAPLLKRRYYGVLRNVAIILTIIMLLFTWRGEIKALILSVSAITAGLLVAFKEVILSFFAYFIISSNQLFKVGDILEIDDKVGRVVDKSLIYTRIALLGPHKDKEVVVPNVYFVSSRFINLSASINQSKSFELLTAANQIEEKRFFLHDCVREMGFDNVSSFIDFETPSTIRVKVIVSLKEGDMDFNDMRCSVAHKFISQYPHCPTWSD